MKKHILNTFLLILLALGFTQFANAQSYGEIKGKVTVEGKPAQFYYVIATRSGVEKGQDQTTELGNYNITQLEAGTYTIEILDVTGSPMKKKEGIVVGEGTIVDENITIGQAKGTNIGPIVVKNNIKVTRDETKQTFNRKSLNQTGKGVGGLVALTAGVSNATGGNSIGGSRTDGTAVFVDGVRVSGSSALASQSIGNVSIYQSGIPAQFGDFTGGAISITTRGISRRRVRVFEARTSQFLDAFGSNSFEMYFSGPLVLKRYKEKNKKGKMVKKIRPLIGYGLGGSISYRKENAPSYVPFFVLKDDVQQRINENPLTRSNAGAIVHAGNFITKDDMEEVKIRPNADALSGNMNLKLDFAPTKNATITAFGSYSGYYQKSSLGQNFLLMNSGASPLNDGNTIRTYLRYVQKLKNPSKETQKKKTTLINAAYTIRLDYQNSRAQSRDAEHKDNIFNYGYIGKFTKYPTEFFTWSNPANDPTKAPDKFTTKDGKVVYARDYYKQIGFRDTAMHFQRSELNPLRANYTSNLYDIMNSVGGNITSNLQVQQLNGLLNGDNPQNVYSLYATPGFITSGYSKSQSEVFTVYSVFEGKIQGATYDKEKKKVVKRRKHDIQFGVTYEQRNSRSYGVSATNLWTLMPQLANKHIAELDISNPILSFDKNGVFQDTVRYNRLNNSSDQSTFDKSLRKKLIDAGALDVYGNAVDELTYLDVNSYGPDMFSLDMFSADELLNNGNPYISYNGYDYLGNKLKGKPSIEDFLNDPTKRSIGGFQPIYGAMWLQDKFDFGDLVIRAGVRVERYDANQPILKDPYSLYPIRTVGEVTNIGGKDVSHPDNISEDAKVYVNDLDAPTKVLGYREGDVWYDHEGNVLSNPEILANESASGQISPYLVDKDNQQITSESFTDYTPDVNVLPRLFFSFPLKKDNSWFFASYDVLAQRPTGRSFMTIDNYYFMREKATNTFNNPNLKSRIKNNYEVGFKQRLTRSSLLNLIASYSEIRNDIQLRNFTQAYPLSYTSYDNIDFATIKSFRAEYNVDNGKHLAYAINYTLLFADGTGSNTNAQRALIQAQLPSMRSLLPLSSYDIRHTIKGQFNYNFKGGKDKKTKEELYNGPIWKIGKKDRKVFEYVNANFSFVTNSGLPYTPRDRASQLGTAVASNIKGNPFNARMPWQFRLDGNITKSFLLKIGKMRDEEGKKTGEDRKGFVDVFLNMTNILNTQNVRSVFAFTGEAQDDGFLNSPQGQQVISTQLDAQAFQDLYNTILNTQGVFLTPRLTRLGIRLRY